MDARSVIGIFRPLFCVTCWNGLDLTLVDNRAGLRLGDCLGPGINAQAGILRKFPNLVLNNIDSNQYLIGVRCCPRSDTGLLDEFGAFDLWIAVKLFRTPLMLCLLDNLITILLNSGIFMPSFFFRVPLLCGYLFFTGTSGVMDDFGVGLRACRQSPTANAAARCVCRQYFRNPYRPQATSTHRLYLGNN